MKLICSNFTIICNLEFDILENYALLIDNGKIVEIDREERLLKKYKEIDALDFGKNSVLIAGFVNPHIHLEFSANRSKLEYGNFLSWLKSVIKNREDLIEECGNSCIKESLNSMLRTGVVAIGAISSYGFDIAPAIESPIKVTLFSEILGSKPEMVDTLYEDFLSRFYQVKSKESASLKSAIAIHSPYSTHPILIKKVLQFAKEQNSLVSTHFLESKEEREWLDSSKGRFQDFFREFLNQNRALTTPEAFISQFKDVKTLFTHNLYANSNELELISKLNSHIISCPKSNRLLNSKKLNLEALRELNLKYSFATDGLSSNNSIDILEELRFALFMYESENLNSFAKELILANTNLASKALNLSSGEIKVGKSADFAIFKLPQIQEIDSLAYNLILHSKEVEALFIDGIEYVK